MKTCSKCHKEKSLDDFNRRSKISLTYSSYCKECSKNYQKLWYDANEEVVNKKHNLYYENNKEKCLIKNKEYYSNNRTKILKQQKEYLNNPLVREKRREVLNVWTKKKLKEDPNFRIRRTVSTRIWHALNGTCKSKKTQELLGCSIVNLRNYLEKQFKRGMSWKNYGKWHIDHIKPCDSFDLTSLDEQLKCFHYTNLQPMWAFDNQSKGKKFISTL
jgi:hypothetical protein